MDELPDEIVFEILTLLDYKAVLAFSAVSRACYRVARDPLLLSKFTVTPPHSVTDMDLSRITHHIPHFTSFNLASCYRITDRAFQYLGHLKRVVLPPDTTARGLQVLPPLVSLSLSAIRHLSDEHLSVFLRRSPTLRELTVTSCSKVGVASMMALAAFCPGLTSLTAAYCRCIETADIVAVIAHCPSLTHLSLELLNVSDPIVTALGMHLPLQLELRKSLEGTSDGKRKGKAESPLVPMIAALDELLALTWKARADLLHLTTAESAHDLGGPNGDASVQVQPLMFAHPQAGLALQSFVCRRIKMDGGSFGGLAGHPSLTHLDASWSNKFAQVDLAAVATLPKLSDLKVVWCPNLRGSCLTTLLGLDGSSPIRTLSVARCRSLDLQPVCKLDNLERLDVAGANSVSSELLMAFAAAPWTSRLTDLNLSDCRASAAVSFIPADALAALLAACPLLTTLELPRCSNRLPSTQSGGSGGGGGPARKPSSPTKRVGRKTFTSSTTATSSTSTTSSSSVSPPPSTAMTHSPDGNVGSPSSSPSRVRSIEGNLFESLRSPSRLVSLEVVGISSLELMTVAQRCPCLRSLSLNDCPRVSSEAIRVLAFHCHRLQSLFLAVACDVDLSPLVKFGSPSCSSSSSSSSGGGDDHGGGGCEGGELDQVKGGGGRGQRGSWHGSLMSLEVKALGSREETTDQPLVKARKALWKEARTAKMDAISHYTPPPRASRAAFPAASKRGLGSDPAIVEHEPSQASACGGISGSGSGSAGGDGPGSCSDGDRPDPRKNYNNSNSSNSSNNSDSGNNNSSKKSSTSSSRSARVDGDCDHRDRDRDHDRGEGTLQGPKGEYASVAEKVSDEGGKVYSRDIKPDVKDGKEMEKDDEGEEEEEEEEEGHKEKWAADPSQGERGQGGGGGGGGGGAVDRAPLFASAVAVIRSHAKSLVAVDLGGEWMGSHVAAALCDCRRLERLSLTDSLLDDDDLLPFEEGAACSVPLPALAFLSLAGSSLISEIGIARCALAAPFVSRLALNGSAVADFSIHARFPFVAAANKAMFIHEVAFGDGSV